MERKQFEEAMTKSVALLEATAAVAKAQSILMRAGLLECDATLAHARGHLDDEYKHHEGVIKRWRDLD